MSFYAPSDLLYLWQQEQLTAEQAMGHMLQIVQAQQQMLLAQQQRLRTLEQQLVCVEQTLTASNGRASGACPSGSAPERKRAATASSRRQTKS